MTTTTYGTHAFANDCNSITSWNETVNNMIGADATLESIYDEYFKITAVFDGNLDEYCFYEYDLTNFSSTIYTTAYVRYKTSAASNGAGARVLLKHDDYAGGDSIATNVTNGKAQWILGASNPLFSQTLTIASTTLTTAKTIDKICVFADNYPDTAACNGTHYVYYDYIVLTKKPFTFPNKGVRSIFHPPMRFAIIPIPGRWGDITQNLGSESATWDMSCDLKVGNWKRTTTDGYAYNDYVDGQIFHDINCTDAFQILDTETEFLKVTLEDLTFNRQSDNPTIDLLWREYRRAGANSLPENYVERFGLDL